MNWFKKTFKRVKQFFTNNKQSKSQYRIVKADELAKREIDKVAKQLTQANQRTEAIVKRAQSRQSKTQIKTSYGYGELKTEFHRSVDQYVDSVYSKSLNDNEIRNLKGIIKGRYKNNSRRGLNMLNKIKESNNDKQILVKMFGRNKVNKEKSWFIKNNDLTTSIKAVLATYDDEYYEQEFNDAIHNFNNAREALKKDPENDALKAATQKAGNDLKMLANAARDDIQQKESQNRQQQLKEMLKDA